MVMKGIPVNLYLSFSFEGFLIRISLRRKAALTSSSKKLQIYSLFRQMLQFYYKDLNKYLLLIIWSVFSQTGQNYSIFDQNNKKIQRSSMKQNLIQSQKDNERYGQIKSVMEQHLVISSLQSRNKQLLKQNTRLQKEMSMHQSESQSMIENQKFHISILEDRNRQLLVQKRQLDINYDTLKINYQQVLQQYNQFQIAKQYQIQQLKSAYTAQIQALQATITNYSASISQYQKLKRDLNDFKQSRQIESQGYRTALADIERQKIQSIDVIKKQMLSKAYEMRNKALQIRKEQLQVTTRLTFLQNDQLIRELQYQSAKTQEILARNSKLEDQIKQLKVSIQIYKQVEKEIMKRNVMAKNIIENISSQQKCNNVEGMIKQAKDDQGIVGQRQAEDKIQKRSILKKVQGFKGQRKQTYGREQKLERTLRQENGKQKQDIKQIKQYLKKLENSIQEKNTSLFEIKREKQKLEQQVKKAQAKLQVRNVDTIASLMLRFLEQIILPLKPQEALSIKESIQNNDKDEIFNLEELRNVDVSKWSLENLEKIVHMILNELRPFLSLKILKLPYYQSSQSKKLDSVNYTNLQQNLYLPKYLQAVKRQQSKSIQSIKSRSFTYIIDKNQKKSYRKNSVLKAGKQNLLQPVAKRFIKPHILNKL